MARATIDIDLLIVPKAAEKVIGLAANLDYRIRGVDMSSARGEIEIRRVSKIDPEDGELLSLDLLLVTPQIQSVWDSRIEASWDGRKIRVVSPAGLIALKRLRGSGQDLDDIKKLEEGMENGED